MQNLRDESQCRTRREERTRQVQLVEHPDSSIGTRVSHRKTQDLDLQIAWVRRSLIAQLLQRLSGYRPRTPDLNSRPRATQQPTPGSSPYNSWQKPAEYVSRGIPLFFVKIPCSPKRELSKRICMLDISALCSSLTAFAIVNSARFHAPTGAARSLELHELKDRDQGKLLRRHKR